ncbi:LLM class flavin-dependent oxidoreductase [Corynebacterium propinquum]|uniref:LLM class flavin-dependent oxidoreductase n=1 Tax=Corynebacterium propinquum TaxID=43769 RepID=UPI002543F0B0|nr:LLM class flavin-dependent oxidoreductase [Corynebacterium propinquum]MDK4252129.1 LLM class flavin-dependent oxidoreductase [Corynebacterium propinquum]
MADTEITLHWYLPTYGDSRQIIAGGHGGGIYHGEREPTLDYLTQIALAAEANGFESLLTPTGQWCADSWVTDAALLARTSRIKFLIAFRPGLVSTPLIAQQTQTLQELSGGRVLLNVVVGGEDIEQRAYGDYTTKEQRYARADEALALAQDLWTSQEPITRQGTYETVENAQLAKRPETTPRIFFGGSSQPGIEVAGRRADVYLTWGETPDKVAEKLERVRQSAAAAGREIEYGIRLHIIARDTSQQAWAEAQRLLDSVDPEEVQKIQKDLARSQSEGQRLQSELHGQGKDFVSGADARELEIAPNLWAGVGLLRGGAGTALVGSHQEVAQRLAEYRDAGIKHFIVSGYPHLEETWTVGEGVVPQLQKLGYPVTNR